MKIITSIYCLLVFVSCTYQSSKPQPLNEQNPTQQDNIITNYANLDYDKVVAYDYDYTLLDNVIDAPTKNKKSVRKETILTKEEIKSFIKIIEDSTSYGGDKAKCFNPHFSIIFYKGNETRGYINICFECNFLYSSLPLAKAIVSEPNDLNYSKGFSKTCRIELENFCKKLKFSIHS